MKAIRVRGIPDDVADKIQHLAEANGTSMNRTVIDLLVKAVEPPRQGRRLYHDLDQLIGCWSAQDSEQFDAALKQSAGH